VVRHDDDDPYLVVAADKGTATLRYRECDSVEHGFAARFASRLRPLRPQGHGHHGARAGKPWKRHSARWTTTSRRRLHVAGPSATCRATSSATECCAETEARRRLRSSRHLHRSDPNPEKKLRERDRLFRLPRSSWQDYDKALISKGAAFFRS